MLAAFTCLPLLLGTQGSAQTTLLNFSCEGKTGGWGETQEPLHNIGLVVNLADKTVSFAGYVAPFKTVDAANIYFSGSSQSPYGLTATVDGNIDRVTGAVTATISTRAGSANPAMSQWDMLCKPTSRLF